MQRHHGTSAAVCAAFLCVSFYFAPFVRCDEGASSLYVSPEAFRHHIPVGVVLVDVRPSRDFDAAHIPGSQNVPLFALKAKSFLKSKKTVILNNGFPATPLEDECLLLRIRGWNIFVLEGGLRRWEKSGLPLEGTPSSPLDLLSPADYAGESGSGRWRPLEAGGDEDAFQERLDQEARRPSDGTPLLVINETGDYTKVRPMLERKKPSHDVLYLSGGRAALRVFERSRAAMENPGQARAGGRDMESGCGSAVNGGSPCH